MKFKLFKRLDIDIDYRGLGSIFKKNYYLCGVWIASIEDYSKIRILARTLSWGEVSKSRILARTLSWDEARTFTSIKNATLDITKSLNYIIETPSFKRKLKDIEDKETRAFLEQFRRK